MSDEVPELEQLLRFVYQCPSAVVRMRRDGAIDLLNAAACALLLPRAPGGQLTNLLEVLDPVAPSLRPAVLAFSGETGTVVDQVQVRLTDATGDPCVVALTIVAVDRETCVAVLNDVTRVVEQERKLYMQEQRLQAILDNVHEYAIFTLDPNGRVDSWNPSLGRLTEMDGASILGCSLYSLAISPPPRPLQELLSVAQQSGWAEYAAPHRRAAASEYWGEAIVTPIFGLHQEMTGFGVVLRDATAKRRYEEELVRLATRDPLMGICNRRAFFEAAAEELSRSDLCGHEVSVVMIDVDHFKSVNDVHGHGAGDQVLKAVAKRCSAALRTGDLLGRLGGEELAVLAPDTSLDQAAELAERIREALAASEIAVDSGSLRVTVSAGAASRPAGSPESFDAMLQRADEALYAAKRGGRNRVSIARPAVVEIGPLRP